MSGARKIPDDLLHRQLAASDPSVSAWVAANAGSGKTYVLAQRVVRLLLDGVDPAKILCITFTKAAAANMANKVFGELRNFTALDDDQLDAAIRRVSNAKPDASLRRRARQLFAVALETPGGLKVQTIHAFCTRLLQQFPFEANVAARFTVLDEAAEAQLLEQTSMAVLLEAAASPESALGRALSTAIACAADQTFKNVVGEAIRKRDLVCAWSKHAGSVEAAIADLCGAFGIDPQDTLENVDAEIVEGPMLPSRFWPRAAEIFASGTSADRKQAERLAAAIAASGRARAEAYLDLFLTKEREPRSSLITNPLARKHPELAGRLAAEQPQLLHFLNRRKALACRDRTSALITVADSVISRYQAAKERRGLLDYDDLITRAVDLLSADRAAWVHYKLDRGIDHVLIDEAQDTSPKQWRIIRHLVDEFFAGAGARALKRTIFAVGDEKQSIFSFQGAAPREFDAMRRAFNTLCRAAEHELRDLQLSHSFRSGETVLGAVDKVFLPKEIYASVTSDSDGIPPHIALPGAAPGAVEIWDTIKPDEKPEIEAWDAPFDDLTETSPPVRLANKIARHVKLWMARGALAGDVLVLVRQRGALFEAVIRALKNENIAVAGADRLVLADHIAVMDLMVLADALLLPQDDLALATALKSPLFGFDDEDLFEIAWGRQRSLRAALRAKASTSARFGAAAEKLDRFAGLARLESPFAFYARVLGPERGRKHFLARLGHEANDALDEFLNAALDYESRETPSLQGFVAWLRAVKTDVKRDMEIARDEVRVMTVHGAKGLEAPIVVLADTTTPPAGPAQRQPRLLALPADGAPGSPERFVWIGPRATDVALVGAARERARKEAEDEHRRLLYVAMTRAIERLVVCGVDGERKRPEGCWYDLVHQALAPISVLEPADDGDGEVLRYRKAAPANEAARVTAAAAVATPTAEGLPQWLDTPVPVERAPLVPTSPSRAYDETGFSHSGRRVGTERQTAIERGNAIHRLLQSLPDVPPSARLDAAREHLARRAAGFSGEERERMIEEVARVLGDSRFEALFLPGSHAEVPIVGHLTLKGRTIAVAGQVDRLAVTPEAVLIADYKTNRPAPVRIEEVPQPYIAQLALYRAVLATLYPQHEIRAALLWTDGPALMEVPGASLDDALARLTAR